MIYAIMMIALYDMLHGKTVILCPTRITSISFYIDFFLDNPETQKYKFKFEVKKIGNLKTLFCKII